jgi:hypothetical protein
MSGVLIDRGWPKDPGHPGEAEPATLDGRAPERDAGSAPSTTVGTLPRRVRHESGQLVQFPPFSHPSLGFPDFAASASRRRSARRRFHRRVALAFLAGGLVFAASWIVAANDIGTHNALASARSTLAHTRHQLAAVSAQRDTYQAQLRQAQDQLSQAQQSLSSAQSQLNLQGSQITVLKTCLGGVLTSLSYAANSDYTDAISTINGVSGACSSAASLLGSTSSTPAATGPTSTA